MPLLGAQTLSGKVGVSTLRSREKIKGTGRGGGGSGHRKECCSEVPIQRMGHRAPATQTAKLTKDPKTALSVSHLLASASRSHHFWGFCLLLHGQDTENTSLHDTVSSAILPPQSWQALLNLEEGRHR